MKIKMNENGHLSIEKREDSGIYDAQYCHRQSGDVRCGHWCPHFSTISVVVQAIISICEGKSYRVGSNDFTDTRPSLDAGIECPYCDKKIIGDTCECGGEYIGENNWTHPEEQSFTITNTKTQSIIVSN